MDNQFCHQFSHFCGML